MITYYFLDSNFYFDYSPKRVYNLSKFIKNNNRSCINALFMDFMKLFWNNK